MSTENISEREGLDRLESLFKEGSFKEASAFASDLREEYPSSFQIGFLNYRILVNLERYSESENILDELLKLYPENINLLLEKGELLVGRGKTAESKLFFDKVLFLDPVNSKAKEGVDRIKSVESGSPAGFEKRERGKVVLEDTMKEADLERFMKEDTSEGSESGEVGEEEPEEELDISMSESGIGFSADMEKLMSTPPSGEETSSQAEEKELVSDEMIKTSGKVESALEELDKFSRSDISDLGLAKEPEVLEKEPEVEESNNGGDEAFVTESAALLYLKQGLYDDARNVYIKLYKGSDENLFIKKIDKVERVEKAKLKIIALEGFLEKIKTGSVRIV